MSRKRTRNKFLFTDSDWNFDTMRRTYHAIEKVARDDLGLDVYPNQIEIISSEQMLDAYASHGMPLMYRHWAFGKRFVREEELYRKGYTGLAYEIVINSNPCISYNMEENTMAVQALVMAHAAFGHNHFFKNNYLFQQWTDADGIIDYLSFAKNYIAECEEKYGYDNVEETLDAAHALMDQGVFRSDRPHQLSEKEKEERARRRRQYDQATFNDIWRTLPEAARPKAAPETEEEWKKRRNDLHLPEENLLFFVEKHAPKLETWQREILRIVRFIAQYFYPQKQTKVMNEGCATFVHHYIMNELYQRGQIAEGALLEILHNHSNVVFQPSFDDPRYSGINPYALGFEMMQDIKRICEEPTEEDTKWFPDLAGSDWRESLRFAWANFRDESFIRQYLSPKLIRDLKLFLVVDDAEESHYLVGDIHDDHGYRHIREALADSYDIGLIEPNVVVTDVDLHGDRVLHLRHYMQKGVPLAKKTRNKVLQHLLFLWGHPVHMASKTEAGKVLHGVQVPDADFYDDADEEEKESKKKKK